MNEPDIPYLPSIPVNAERPVRVLLVDDQPFVAEAVRRSLSEAPDIDFHYCNNPADAIDSAQRIKPTVVLLDIVMPDIDGMTLCRFFRSHAATCDLPIVMLSSNDDALVKAAAFAAGANDYLVKLPDKSELTARLRYHSRAYVAQLQRDEAYSALHASQRKLEELNLELLQLANQDGLTGLANRRFFNERYVEEWARAARNQRPLSLIMLDVDYFKAYNDGHGHLAGDQCLIRMATAIKGVVGRSSDLAARYGGEEFIVILPETEPDGAVQVAERMLSALGALAIPHGASSVAPHVTVSLGVASATPYPRTNPDALIDAADQCLYEAKRQGRNRIAATVLAFESLQWAD